MEDLLQLLALTADDQRAARQRALTTFGLGLLGARKGREWEQVGKSGLLALEQRDRILSDMQAGKARDFQIKEYQKKLEREEEARKKMAQYDKDYAAAAYQSPTAGMQDQSPTNANVAAIPKPWQARRDAYLTQAEIALRNSDVKRAEELGKLAAKVTPKVGKTEEMTDPHTGARVMVNFYEDGTREVMRDVGAPKAKLHFADTGGMAGVGQDPFSGAVQFAGLPKTMDPAQKDTSARGWAQHALEQKKFGHQVSRDARTDEAGKWQYDAERGVLVNPATAQSRPVMAGNEPIGAKGVSKQKEQAQNALDVIAEAEAIIPRATGSLVGTGIDLAAGAVGLSPDGADAIAQLQALEARLMLTQPRMEGPQSDRDTQLYKQAAGKIGDPMVPNSQKLAALEVIKKMTQKYPSNNATAKNGPARIASQAEYDALRSGSEYIAPDGSVRRKK